MEIERGHGVVPRKMSSALAGVELQTAAVAVEPATMSVSVEEDVDACQAVVGMLRVVQDQNPAAGPVQLQGFGEFESELGGHSVETRPIEVVVAVDPYQGELEARETGQGVGARKVSGVDDALDGGLPEEIDDPLDVDQTVVGVAHHSDAHVVTVSSGD